MLIVSNSAYGAVLWIDTEDSIRFPRHAHIKDRFDRNAPDSAITSTVDD